MNLLGHLLLLLEMMLMEFDLDPGLVAAVLERFYWSCRNLFLSRHSGMLLSDWRATSVVHKKNIYIYTYANIFGASFGGGYFFEIVIVV